MASARAAAVEVLLAVERSQSVLATQIERARRGLRDERERALLIEIVMGTLRWRAELDALLARCLTRPIAEIDPATRAILRVAAYQLEHLDRVPAHAVVHDAVDLTRHLGSSRAGGFVNAVLRTWQRRRPHLRLPPRPGRLDDRRAWIAYLATTLSHPAWLVTRWLDRHGAEATERWCQFNNRPPAIAMRIPKDDAPAISSSSLLPLRFVADGCEWSRETGAMPADLRARCVIQDEASQIVAHLVGATPGDTVLDVCAAPGGKSLILASDMHGRGLLVSCDTRPRRMRLLAAMLRQGGVVKRLVQLDATRSLPFGPVFDRVLVDAPCSGLGVIARDPDLKWSRTETDLPRLVEQEGRMLRAAAGAVRPGGRLIYATCSSEPDENEDVVDAFLRDTPAFSRHRPGPAPQVRRLDELLTGTGDLRTWPFAHDLDAFFAAFLVKREAP